MIETVSIVRHEVFPTFEEVMNRPKKSLHPFVLSVHALLLAARSLCSVVPTVRHSRGLSDVGISRPDSDSPVGGAERFFMCASAKEGRRQ